MTILSCARSVALVLLVAASAFAGGPTDAQRAYGRLVAASLPRGQPDVDRLRAYADHAHLDLKVAVTDGVHITWPDLTIERQTYRSGLLIRSQDNALAHALQAAIRSTAARGVTRPEIIEVRGNEQVWLRGEALRDPKVAQAALAAAWGGAKVGTEADRARAGSLWSTPSTRGDRLRFAAQDGVVSLELQVTRSTWDRYLRDTFHAQLAADHERAKRTSASAPAREYRRTPTAEYLCFARGTASRRWVERRERQRGKTDVIRLRRRVGGPPAFVAPLVKALGMSALQAPTIRAIGNRGLNERLEQALEKAVKAPRR